jgi:hypothetical protein
VVSAEQLPVQIALQQHLLSDESPVPERF